MPLFQNYQSRNAQGGVIFQIIFFASQFLAYVITSIKRANISSPSLLPHSQPLCLFSPMSPAAPYTDPLDMHAFVFCSSLDSSSRAWTVLSLAQQPFQCLRCCFPHTRSSTLLAEWNSYLNSGNMKNELLISWAEIFEDFQSLRITIQSEKFKE